MAVDLMLKFARLLRAAPTDEDAARLLHAFVHGLKMGAALPTDAGAATPDLTRAAALISGVLESI